MKRYVVIYQVMDWTIVTNGSKYNGDVTHQGEHDTLEEAVRVLAETLTAHKESRGGVAGCYRLMERRYSPKGYITSVREVCHVGREI